MKRVKQYIGIFVLLLIAGSFTVSKTCQAASAEVTMKTDATQVSVGDKFYVSIYINSSTEFGNFEANVTYDEEILEYRDGPQVITGDSGYLRISDMGVLNGDTTRKYTLEFEALKVGLCEIEFSGRAIVYDFENDNEMSVSSTDLTINVKAPIAASDNASLKTLKIDPSELTPEFNPELFEYSVSVSNDTTQMVITAMPEDTKSSVSITGNDLLKEGENKVIVSVLAESGNIIEYTINVTREATLAVDITQEPVKTPEEIQSSFELIEEGGVIYAIYNGKYTILEPDSSIIIPDGYKTGSLNLLGVSVTAFIPVNNEESEFILLYARNDRGEAGLYHYDRIEKTLQRYLPDSMIINEGVADSEDENALTKEYNTNLTKAVIVIALLAVLCILMTAALIRLLLKSKDR